MNDLTIDKDENGLFILKILMQKVHMCVKHWNLFFQGQSD
jgi:hypothetical protein